MPLSLHDGTPEQVAEKTFTKQYTRQILWISKTICKNDSMITLVSINEKLKPKVTFSRNFNARNLDMSPIW